MGGNEEENDGTERVFFYDLYDFYEEITHLEGGGFLWYHFCTIDPKVAPYTPSDPWNNDRCLSIPTTGREYLSPFLIHFVLVSINRVGSLRPFSVTFPRPRFPTPV